MHVSGDGIAFLKKFESCRLEAYLDVRGIWTIGWGHTGPDVKKGVKWTQAWADAEFVRDVGRFDDCVGAAVTASLSQQQFDALVSFAYNVGETAFRQSTLLRKVNAGDFAGAKAEFARWNKATVDGKLVTVPGLSARRRAEAALFSSGI